MVREGSSTSMAKLGLGKVKYFTTKLISMVCSPKTLKTSLAQELKMKK
jgi:hypothetical protein